MATSEQTALPVIISGMGPSALLLAHALLRATPPIPFRLYERDLSLAYRAQGYRFRVSGRGVKSCREVLDPEHFALLRATCGENQTARPRRLNALTGEPLPLGFSRPPAKADDKAEADAKSKVEVEVKEENLTADRTVMRQALFKGLEGYATFGKEIVGYEDCTLPDGAPSGNGESADRTGVLVRFSDGSTVRGSLLVAADGAYSRIRAQLLPQIRLLNTELLMAFGKTPLTPEFYAALGASGKDDPRAAEQLEGTTLISDPSQGEAPMFFMYERMCFTARDAVISTDPDLAAAVPPDYVYWALALRSDQPEAQGLDWRAMDSAGVAALAVDLTKDWAPPLRAVVAHQDRSQTMPLRSAVMPAPIPDYRAAATHPASAAVSVPQDVHHAEGASTSSTVPSPQSAASHGPMVTLIGDAAHVIPPTGGVGATTALTDAAVLGAALAAHGVTRRALTEYEAEMRGYGNEAIEWSLVGGKMLVSMRDVKDMVPIAH